MRYTYTSGIKSAQRAEEVLEDAYATGEVLPGERPQVEPYRTTTGQRRYRITLEG
ncbi:hypothetical protein [Tritonibacter mobilis]|uniref:hypothetical protein n=1 Tax=Tritonibacter mobilis TaxID=379347 RepID=UPI0013A5688D|nr:hypothetical protein [Tritonibacter mobilis]